MKEIILSVLIAITVVIVFLWNLPFIIGIMIFWLFVDKRTNEQRIEDEKNEIFSGCNIADIVE
ncbi:MAG: hypothetical protein WC940_03400 [Candidatus Paceibacterota bacterium]|jgi:hypothetical protein